NITDLTLVEPQEARAFKVRYGAANDGQTVEPIKYFKGEKYVYQLVAMPEPSRRQRQSAVYRIAA
ncbi:MAG: hypothetical protein ACRCWP_17230, partial [Shewanella sp.]